MQNATSPLARSSLLPRLILLSVAVFLALGFCEIALRITTREPTDVSLVRGDDFQSVYFELDPLLGVVRRPNLDLRFRFEERPSGFIHFQTNNLGLRRSAPAQAGRTSGRRVLVLGDSQIDGSVDNSENACSLLETDLNTGPERYEILNAATGSYSPYQSYLWYRARGAVLLPDTILFTVFLGNDLAELVAPGRPRLMPEGNSFREIIPAEDFQHRMKSFREPSAWTRLRFLLLQNSVLFARLTSLVGNPGVQATGPMGTAYRACIGCTGQSLGQAYWFKHHPADVELCLSSLEELLRRFKSETDQAGIQLILMVLPTKLQVEPETDSSRTRETAEILGLGEADLQLERHLGAETVRIGRQLNIETIDLAPLLTEHHRETGEILYYRTDWHLNAKGHRILAQCLYDRRELFRNRKPE